MSVRIDDATRVALCRGGVWLKLQNEWLLLQSVCAAGIAFAHTTSQRVPNAGTRKRAPKHPRQSSVHAGRFVCLRDVKRS